MPVTWKASAGCEGTFVSAVNVVVFVADVEDFPENFVSTCLINSQMLWNRDVYDYLKFCIFDPVQSICEINMYRQRTQRF